MSKALIIVDVQYDFLEGGALAVPHSNEILPEIKKYIEKYNFIVATMDWHPKNHISFASRHEKEIGEVILLEHTIQQILWPDHCVQDTEGSKIHKEIIQHAHKIDYVLQKGDNSEIDSYSAFFDNHKQSKTKLDDILCSHKIQEVHVCGLATDYCVKFTVLDALKLGYKVGLLKEGSRAVNIKADDERKAIQDMLNKGAFLV